MPKIVSKYDIKNHPYNTRLRAKTQKQTSQLNNIQTIVTRVLAAPIEILRQEFQRLCLIDISDIERFELRHIYYKMSDHVKPVENLKLDGNLCENWRRFKRNFDIFMLAAELNAKPHGTKINTFLNAIGEQAVEVFDTFNLTAEQKVNYDSVLKSFEDFCTPKKNEVYERFMFYQRKQREGEPFNEYLIEIKRLVRSCAFGEKENEMLRDQIVMNIFDQKLQTKLLEMPNLTYETAIEKCRASEATKEQASTMNKTTCINEVKFNNNNNNNSYRYKPKQNSFINNSNNNTGNRYHGKKNKNFNNNHNNTNQNNHSNKNNTNNNTNNNNKNQNGKVINCRSCNQTHKIRECPAFGKQCNSCLKKNHFSVVCRNKNQNISTITVSDSTICDNNDFYIDDIVKIQTLDNVNKSQRTIETPWTENIRINNFDIAFKIDTGAETDILPFNIFKMLVSEKILRRTSIRLRGFGGNEITPMGMCSIDCYYDNAFSKINFIVVDLNVMPILGLKTSTKFGIVVRKHINRYVDKNIKQINQCLL